MQLDVCIPEPDHSFSHSFILGWSEGEREGEGERVHARLAVSLTRSSPAIPARQTKVFSLATLRFL